jgi:hypothetical protein
MPNVTISLDDEIKEILEKRAKRNLFTLKEQIEDILRKSAVRTKTGSQTSRFKIDDTLVDIFSRQRSGRKRK